MAIRQRRQRGRLSIRLVTAAAVAFAGFAVGTEAVSAELGDVAPDILVPAPNTTVVASVALPNNVVLLQTAGGSYVVGPSDLQLTIVDDELGSRLGVAVPDPGTSATPGWSTDLMRSVLEQVRGGVSLDEVAAHVRQQVMSPNTNEPLYNAVCVDANSNAQYQVTCTHRKQGYTVGSSKYVGSASFTYAQISEPMRSNYELARITHTDNYDSGTQQIVDWTPSATLYGSNCGNYTLSLTAFGVGLSLTKPLCPRQTDPYLFSAAQQFKTTWRGKVSGAASSHQIETVKVPAAADSLLIFSGYSEARVKCATLNVFCTANQLIWGD